MAVERAQPPYTQAPIPSHLLKERLARLEMNLAAVSLGALLLAIILSCTTRINVGLLGLALAWVVGVYLGGMSLAEVVSGFPSQLFLTLAGVTLLFAMAQVNGTLDKIAQRAVRSCRGNLGLIPIMFFALAFVLGSIGPGSIAAAALMAPMAMAVAGRTGISAFLMAIMVGNGANASSLSPVAPTGIIVRSIMDRLGIEGVDLPNYFAVMIAHTAVGFAGYFAFGGWRLFSRASRDQPLGGAAAGADVLKTLPAPESFTTRDWAALAVIGVLIASVVFFEVHVGMGALAGGVLLAAFRLSDDLAAIKAMPWSPILMVTGVTVLISLLEKTGGMDLFTSMLAGISSAETVTGVTALLTGFISVYSSTSGVVLPAFLPTVPDLMTKLGGGEVLPIILSMLVGSHLVDVSPLSTTGALCIAAAPPREDIRALFRKMLAWGLSMVLVGGLGCYLVFGLLWSR